MSKARRTILITGGAGFMGSMLVEQWLREETPAVVNLDKLTYAGLRESLAEGQAGALGNDQHLLVEGDVADGPLVGRLLAEHRPEAVLHLAAESHVDRSIAVPPPFAMTNVVGTCVLLDEATRYWKSLPEADRDRFRFLYVSTDEVFGSAGQDERFDEESPMNPSSPYAASKASGEQLAYAFAHTYGLPVLVVNPTNNYGPRQLPEKLIPKMILAAAAGRPLPVYGDGLHERDWLYVGDCCRAIRQVLHRGKPGRRYLVGADNGLANLQVVETICDLVDELQGPENRRQLIQHVEDRPGHDRRYAIDSQPARKELGWQPEVDFERGLKETVRWYLKNCQWVQQAVERLEQSGE